MKHRKLRRMGILVLVLVLLFNTLGARASTTNISVSTYEELLIALEQAENLDTITVTSFLVIPMGSSLGDSSKQVIIKFADAGALEFEQDNTFSNPSTVTNLIIDGDGKKSLYPMLRARGKIDFINCEFKRANEGAVYAGYADLTFTDCTFFSNVGTYGGHFNAGYNTTATFDNCSFSYGTSTVRGGGIYSDGNTCNTVFRDCVITANESVYGGGIFNNGNLVLESTLLYNNHASIGGDDLCNSTGSYELGSLEEMWQAFRDKGITIKPLEWQQSTDEYSGWEYYKLLYTADVPIEPTPEETETPPSGGDEDIDSSTGDNTGDTEVPSEDEQEPSGGNEGGNGEDPSTPIPEDPSISDEGDHTTDIPQEQEPPVSTPSDAENTGGGDTVDNSNQSTIDNSQTNIDNSQSTSSIDNASHESNDNSSYREDNSYRDSSSTVNNYYQQESPIQESSTASQNGSQPINITVPVEVSTSEEKEAPMGSTGAPEGERIATDPQQNIKIEAEGVDLVYEYTEGGINISISSPEVPESPTEAVAVNFPTPTTETPQEADKSPNWVEYGSVILLAILVWLEVKDRWKNKA